MSPALPKIRWHCVYLLCSKPNTYAQKLNRVKDWFYIGFTNNLKKRLLEHKQGKVYSTRKMLPLELIYFEAYRSKNIAFAREKALKQYGSSLAKLKLRLGIAKKGRAG